MGREVRRVPPHWLHPMKGGQYQPMGQLDMPHWKDGEATHYQMYETNSSGTPLSPVMASPENLAHWLVENQITAYEGQTASYEAWLMVAQGRTVISNVVKPQKLIQGSGSKPSTEPSQPEARNVFSEIDQRVNQSRAQKLKRE